MLYSIIIPHYNSINSLVQLLNTIPSRDDIEVIIIDDNSDEKFLDSLQALPQQKKSLHIRLYENTSSHKGAGACRNIGLAHAQGKWLIFADADDYFVDNVFSIIEANLRDELDIAYFSPTSRCLINNELSDRHIHYCSLVTDYLEKAIEHIRYRFVVPWSKVYRHDFISKNHIRFDEVIASNDVMFSLKAGHLAKEIHVSVKSIYCVTRGKGTLTVNKSHEVLLSRFNVEMRRLTYLKRHNISTIRNSLVGLGIKYRKIIDVTLFKLIIRAYLDKKITIFPPNSLEYLKQPRMISTWLKRSDSSSKYQ